MPTVRSPTQAGGGVSEDGKRGQVVRGHVPGLPNEVRPVRPGQKEGLQMSIVKEINKIAAANGYDGDAPKTVVSALDALSETLAGDDVDSGGTIAPAVAASASYVGSGTTPTGTISITENGEGIDVSSYATANVAVPNPSTGTLTITENGENIDVSQYAYVTVAVTAAESTEPVV